MREVKGESGKKEEMGENPSRRTVDPSPLSLNRSLLNPASRSRKTLRPARPDRQG